MNIVPINSPIDEISRQIHIIEAKMKLNSEITNIDESNTLFRVKQQALFFTVRQCVSV